MINILTDELPIGKVNVPYHFVLSAECDEWGVLIWEVENSLPHGLRLSKDGVVSGSTPKAIRKTITFRVTNADNLETTSKKLNLFIQSTMNLLLPIGTVITYAGEKTPKSEEALRKEGWLFCLGQVVRRDEYSELFNVIGVLYGGGDGIYSFNLPNYQGQFLRGVSHGSFVDPDADFRTPQKNQSAQDGSARGNQVGTFQNDEIIRHKHELPLWDGSFQGQSADDSPFDNMGTNTGHTREIGGNETRPKNVYVNFLILAKH